MSFQTIYAGVILKNGYNSDFCISVLCEIKRHIEWWKMSVAWKKSINVKMSYILLIFL